MSIIACHSDTEISTDLARLINHFRDPLTIKKESKIGLTSLSFAKPKQYIVDDTNNEFYLRTFEEDVDEIGQQIRIKLDNGDYTGDDLADHITTKISTTYPLVNFQWICIYDKEKESFEINCVQIHGINNNLTLASHINPSSGTNSFVNNGTSKVTWTTAGYTTSTSFANRVTDQSVWSDSQLLPDGTSVGSIDAPETGGLWTIEVPPQLDNGGSAIGNGTQILSVLPYWQRYGAAGQQPIIGNTRQPVSLTINDDALRNKLQISLDIMRPSSTIDPPSVGWEGSLVNIFSNLDPKNDFGTISIDGNLLSNWSSYAYKIDHVYAQLEVERISEISVWLWHDNAGDGSILEKQKIAVTGQNGWDDYMLRTIDYPLLGLCQKSSGDVDTPSTVKLSGNFTGVSLSNVTSVSAQDISTPIDKTEIRKGNQGALQPTWFAKLGKIEFSDPLDPQDRNPNLANADDLLGMSRYETNTNAVDFSFSSTKPALSTIVTPSVHIELADFNIKALRGKRKDIAKIVGVIPAEELNSNLDTGIIHYSTSTPIMISLNLEHDHVINQMTVNLRDNDGKLLTNLERQSTVTFLVQ